MREYGLLLFALAVAFVGVGLYQARPLLQRWHENVLRDIEQLERRRRQ